MLLDIGLLYSLGVNIRFLPRHLPRLPHHPLPYPTDLKPVFNPLFMFNILVNFRLVFVDSRGWYLGILVFSWLFGWYVVAWVPA